VKKLYEEVASLKQAKIETFELRCVGKTIQVLTADIHRGLFINA